MPLKTSDIKDLIQTTIDWFETQYTETQLYTDYPLLSYFFGEGVRKPVSGLRYNRKIRVRAASSFKFVDLFEVNPPVIEAVMLPLITEVVHYEEKVAWDEKELLYNSGEEEILSLTETRMSAAWENLITNIEENLALPPTKSGDTKSMLGLPYWIRTLSTGQEDTIGGFNGQTIIFRDGSTSNLIAGQDASLPENDRLRNFVSTHSGEMNQQLVRQTRRAMTRTMFHGLSQLGGDTGPMQASYVLFMDHDFADQLEDLTSQGPDDIDGDVAHVTTPKIRNTPVVRVPVFANLAYRPIYGCKKKAMKGLTLKNRWLKRGEPKNHPDAEDTWSLAIKGSGNLTSHDPRAGGFVIHAKR